MKHIPLILATSIGLTPASHAGPVGGRDIAFPKCPKPVQSTILSNSQGGAIDDVEYHNLSGRRIFVADIRLANGKELEVHVNGNGKLIKTSRDIPPRSVPAAVRKAISGIGGRVDDVERDVHANGDVIYRIEIDRRGKPDINLKITPSGKIIKRVVGNNPVAFELTRHSPESPEPLV